MTDSKNIDHILYSLSAASLFDKYGRFKNTVNFDEWRAEQQERYLNLKSRCSKCNDIFIRRDMQWLNIPGHSKLYCVDCFPKVKQRYSFTCHKCEGNFISRQQRTLCDQCRIYDRKAQKGLIQRHKRKSKQKGLPADLDLYDWLYTIRHFDGKCAYCQKEPYQELDHFNPHGGTTRNNCVPACYKCNHNKSNFDPTTHLPVHKGTNYINWDSMMMRWPNIHVSLMEIKRVAAYLMVPFPYEINYNYRPPTDRKGIPN